MNPFLILSCFYHSGVYYEPEVVEEVHGGEGDGDHAEHQVRHRQIQDEDVPGVGLHVARHRGHQDGHVAQEAEDRDGEVADQEEVVPPVLYPASVIHESKKIDINPLTQH